MDYTYFVAGFIALIVGFVAGVVFVVSKGKSKRRLFTIASSIAFVLDWALLINWRQAGEFSPIILLFDFWFFAIYSVVGSVIGAAPLLMARYLWRMRPGQRVRSQNSN